MMLTNVFKSQRVGEDYGLWVVFPLRGKILKPGFRVAEERNPGKPVFFRF